MYKFLILMLLPVVGIAQKNIQFDLGYSTIYKSIKPELGLTVGYETVGYFGEVGLRTHTENKGSSIFPFAAGRRWGWFSAGAGWAFGYKGAGTKMDRTPTGNLGGKEETSNLSSPYFLIRAQKGVWVAQVSAVKTEVFSSIGVKVNF